MLAEGHPVTVERLPARLAAYAAVEQLPCADGFRNRVDRRGQLRYDKGVGPHPGTSTSRRGQYRRGGADLHWLAARPARGAVAARKQ